MKKTILFVSHAVTMAHVARPLRWIEALDPEKYTIVVACREQYRDLIESKGIRFISLSTIEPSRFAEIVRDAGPIYDAATYEWQINEDLSILNTIRPDLVIGDFRHSLTVSARLAQVPYVNIANAYWSTGITRSPPVPESPFVRKVGLVSAKLLLSPILAFILKINFFWMAFLLRNSFRRAGLKFYDFRDVLTDGDIVAYTDHEAMIPLRRKSNEMFVGPFIWSASDTLPVWWDKLRRNTKCVWITLGSSGNHDILPLLLKSLSHFDVDVILSTSGRPNDSSEFGNVNSAAFLPVNEASAAADLVICNGGSPISHAALTYGRPVIGIVSNNDQLLNMAHLQDLNVGQLLRDWNLSEELLRRTISKGLFEIEVLNAARDLGSALRKIDVDKNIRLVTETALNLKSSIRNPPGPSHPAMSN